MSTMPSETFVESLGKRVYSFIFKGKGDLYQTAVLKCLHCVFFPPEAAIHLRKRTSLEEQFSRVILPMYGTCSRLLRRKSS